MVNQFVSKSKTRKAIKTIFPPSMYENYGKKKRGNSRSKSKTKPNTRPQLGKIKHRAPLPPVREHRTAHKAVRAKTLREDQRSNSKSKTHTAFPRQRNNKNSDFKSPRSNNKSLSHTRKQRSETRKPNKHTFSMIPNLPRMSSQARPKSKPKSGSRSRSKPRVNSKSKNQQMSVNLSNQRKGVGLNNAKICNVNGQNHNRASNSIPMYPKKIINNHINII